MRNGTGKVATHSQRRERTLWWISGLLALTLIPHAIVYGVRHTPPGFLSLHIAATMTSIIITVIVICSCTRDEREAEKAQAAYDAGRAESLAAKLDDLEQRIDNG